MQSKNENLQTANYYVFYNYPFGSLWRMKYDAVQKVKAYSEDDAKNQFNLTTVPNSNLEVSRVMTEEQYQLFLSRK